jgi:hypothetical protein
MRRSRRVIHLTREIEALVRDIVTHMPVLSHIDPDRLLVFARAGRRGASGPVATCHAIGRVSGARGYYFWRDAETGRLLRRSPYLVYRSPSVVVNGRRLRHLISISLPRFCDQSLDRLPKRRFYGPVEPWVARLDTLVHELFHIAPTGEGLRAMPDGRGGWRAGGHGEAFFRQVAELVEGYLATRPPAHLLTSVRDDFAALEARHGGVAATVFRGFPAFPRRFPHALARQPAEPDVPIVALTRAPPRRYRDADLVVRQFLADGRTRSISDPEVLTWRPAARAA